MSAARTATLQEILAEHDDGTEFVGAVVAARDSSGATTRITAGHPSLTDPMAAVDPGIAWNIGSVTKTFLAVVVLQLADEGGIDLDAGIDRWFPELADAASITPRQLLQHTSGLAEYIDLPELDPARSWTPAELIHLAEASGRIGAPGSGHAYTNTNYIVLGELVERVTGQEWDTEVRTRIVEPLGLSDTRLIEAKWTAPAHSFVDGVWVDRTGTVDPSVGGAGGALESTIADLLRFAVALANGELLSPEQLAAMETFVAAADYSEFGVDHGYGLGLERYATADVTAFGHMGVGAGHSAFIGFDRQHGTAVAVQFNSDVTGGQAILGLEVLAALSSSEP